MVHPIDGEGCSCILHRNYLLPIIHNLEQEECDNAVEGGCWNEYTPVPHEEDAMPVNCLIESLLGGIPNPQSMQCEPVDLGPTGSISPNSADEGLQANDDMSGSLR